jgi:hypothetical protein
MFPFCVSVWWFGFLPSWAIGNYAAGLCLRNTFPQEWAFLDPAELAADPDSKLTSLQGIRRRYKRGMRNKFAPASDNCVAARTPTWKVCRLFFGFWE